MNKCVKIVVIFGFVVEFCGGKKFGEFGYWGESFDVEVLVEKIV